MPRVVALLLAPVVASGLALKASRIVLGSIPLTWWQSILFVAPDALFFAGLASLVAAVLGAAGSRFASVGVVVAQLLALVAFVIDMFAFGYFRATGTALDYATLAFALHQAGDTAPIAASEVSWDAGVLLAAVPLWIAVAPWVGRGRVARSTLAPRRRGVLVAVGVSLLCFAGSYGIGVQNVPPSLSRDPVLHLAAGLVRASRPEATSSAAAPSPRRTGPTRLERTDRTLPLNVVVVVLELTRADATTAYRPELPVTPFLAEFAKTSTRVERAYAIVPHTSKALVAILCGIEPRASLEIVEAEDNGLPAPCLPRLLSDLGYDTVFFQAPRGSFERRAGLAKNMGFARFLSGEEMPADGFEKINYFGYEDAIMIGPSEQWLRTQAREPFFATYLTSAPHHPYGVPSTHPHREFSAGEWNDYLNTLNYVNGVLARILEPYEAAGLLDRTVFIIVGDHGEAFGEHRLSTHDDVMYDEVLRVPLIIRIPSASPRPATVDGPVNQLLIAPTIVSSLQLRSVGGEWEGDSIFSGAAAHPLYAACYRNPRCLATIRDNLKLIYYFGDEPTRLFDVEADPQERLDLAATHGDLVSSWTEDLTAWALAVEETHEEQTASFLARFVRRTPPAQLRNPLSGRFGDLVEALGCNTRRKNRGRLEVSCELHVLSRLDDRYRVRVRGTVDGEPPRWFDHKPVGGVYPVRNWAPGDYINDAFEILAPDPWENKLVTLCLALQADGEEAVPVFPPPPGSTTCLPFAAVPPRETPAR